MFLPSELRTWAKLVERVLLPQSMRMPVADACGFSSRPSRVPRVVGEIKSFWMKSVILRWSKPSLGRSASLLRAGFARMAVLNSSNTITPSAIESRMAWLRPAKINSRESVLASSLVFSSTTLSRLRLMERNSDRACSRFLEESHAIKATRKYPAMAGEFGSSCIEMARAEMITLLMVANKKLETGVNNTLAIMMGIVKMKRLRPLAISCGLSLKIMTLVIRKRNRMAAIFPGNDLFRR